MGIWAHVNKDEYLDISSDTDHLTQIPILLIIVGVFVLLLGVVGTIGAIFAGTIGGRIILGLYGFVLALLVICEIAGGIAAGVEKDQLSDGFTDSVNDTFINYYSDDNVMDAWDFVQKNLECCGSSSQMDYKTVFNNDSVPESCCKSDDCNRSVVNNTEIYTEGCANKVEDFIDHFLGVIAGVAITFGLLQVIGIVVSCFVAIAGQQGESSGSYQVV